MVSTPTGTTISLSQVKEFISGASFQDMKEILLAILVWFKKHNLGNPFNYNRAFEFISALTHGFILLPVGGGSDAVNPNDESDTREIKTTKYELTKKGSEKSMGFTYNGTTRKPTLKEQQEYCYDKIMRDEYHIWDMVDYEEGAASSIAHSMMIDSEKKVYTFGLEHRTAGFHPDVDNLPPSPESIAERVKSIINK